MAGAGPWLPIELLDCLPDSTFTGITLAYLFFGTTPTVPAEPCSGYTLGI